VNELAGGARTSGAARGNPRSHIAVRAGMLGAEIAVPACLRNHCAQTGITGVGAALIG
jgi:hypothetical protein